MAIPPHLKHKYADEAAWEKSEDFKAHQYALAARLKEKEKEEAEKAQKARFEEIADDDATPPPKELKPGDKFPVTAKEDIPKAPNAPDAPDAPKKKKKKKKSKGQKNAAIIEFAAEAPLTAEQVAAQAELYNPQKSFLERIETCIQKYRSKRKWNEYRSKIFDSYLALGGIKPGPKMFSGGFDPKKAPEMDAEEIHNMTATDYLPDGEESEFIVSFTDIVRAFLSYRLPYELCISKPEDLEHACTIIKNFLNYVLYHNVAPEHANDVLAARDICDLAERELILCKEMSGRFPGRFNMAASVIHEGYYAGMHNVTAPAWQDRDCIETGMELTVAHDIYAESIRKCGTKEQQDTIKTSKVAKRTYMLLEVTDVVMPETLPPVEGETLTGLKTLGVLKLKPWVMEDGDGVNPEVPAGEMGGFDLWLEKENLQYCFKGMKIETRVHRLDNGMRFIDSITGVMCSFYLLLDEEEDDTSEFGP